MTRTTSLILPTPDTTIDQKSEEVEANSEEETENDVEEYMCSVNRVREMYARSYPNISLPPSTEKTLINITEMPLFQMEFILLPLPRLLLLLCRL